MPLPPEGMRLQKRVMRAIGNLDRCTLVHVLHVALKISYLYNYVSELCKKNVELIENHLNPIAVTIGQGENMNMHTRGLNFVAVWPTVLQVTYCPFGFATYLKV
jgi:hypothetical protein